MGGVLSISRPRHGDVLTRHDGREDSGGLVVKVEGAAPPGKTVRVNGIAADVREGTFACEVRLTHKRNDLVAEAGGAQASVAVWWNKGSRKRFRFSCDDNIFF